MSPETWTATPDWHRLRSSRHMAFGITVLVVGWLLYWFRDTALSIESIWRRSETFAHGYVIVPIVIFLIWRDRHRIDALPIKPTAVPIPLFLAVSFSWVVARSANVLSAEQFMLVAMIPVAIWTILGWAMLRGLAFPLAFLFFAVPFGEFTVPKLMDWTADFTVVALGASGVPVFREGNSFIIPSGRWSVVEACSGVRYLIASVVVGALYAYMTYRSWQRRAVFMLAAITVPLIANWLRAYIIVMLGHLSSNRIAAGVDHIIYGWVFFGVVMAALFGVASIWREDEGHTVKDRESPATVGAAAGSLSYALYGTGLVILSLPWPSLHAQLTDVGAVPRVHLGAIAPASGWVASTDQTTGFRPDFASPLAETTQHFAKGEWRVAVFVGYYAAQTQGRELVGHHNQLVMPTNANWREVRRGRVALPIGNDSVMARVSDVYGDNVRLEAMQFYWIDGYVTSSDIIAKLLLGWARLSGARDDSAVVVIFSARDGGGHRSHVDLLAFATEMSGSITAMLDAVRAR